MPDHPPPEHVNLFFRLAAVAAALFVITVFAFTATLFGDPASPAAAILQKNAGKLFVGEVAALVAFGVAAMVVDRRQSLRHRASSPTPTLSEEPSAIDPSSPGQPKPQAGAGSQPG
jgi:hypothetical protein